MYAKVTNKTNRPIGLGLLTVLPDETVDVPKEYQSNPTLISMIENGDLYGEKATAETNGEDGEDGEDKPAKPAKTSKSSKPKEEVQE